MIVVLAVLAASVHAQSLQVIGYAGVLGEWEVTATVTEKPSSGRVRDYAGSLTMKHTGICTRDGPEEKTGVIRLQLSPSRLTATLSVAGVDCTFSGKQADSYTGVMRCPDRKSVPLEVWVK
ncbi:hypothetical protein [Reyranella sp.]|uniref:hypothetical protein n=1 Tax=Reyranella sp. TaxID=1929291 RepID=UPI003D132AA4